MPNILQITPYPIRAPHHGGQIRSNQIAKRLESDGLSVKSIAIFNSDMYPGEVPVINMAESDLRGPFHDCWPVKDFSNGKLLSIDDKFYKKLAEIVSAENPRIIILEEPWLGEAVLRLKSDGKYSGKLIYSSYNIEHFAKKHILNEARVSEREAILKEIRALEQNLCQECDGSVAVTDEDAQVLRDLSAKDVVIAPNGTVRRDIAKLINILPQSVPLGVRYALFVGSAHAPNISGFLDLAIEALPKMHSDERIVVAGGAGEHIQRYLSECKYPYMARDKIITLGMVSDYSLSCLLANASMVLLPILYGGGSNLKTAEALVAGLPIVATGQAFRGYEQYKDRAQVIIADVEEQFSSAIRRQFDCAKESQPKRSRSDFDKLLWASTLTPIIELVHRVS